MKLFATGRYTARFATTHREVEAALRLRYEVFNLELREGLDSSHGTGQDEDAYDAVCDHLVIIDDLSSEVIGTYRMQTGQSARDHLGYYSEQEFEFGPFEPIRSELIELGRACVHRDHRTLGVVSMLWRAIAEYAENNGCRFLIGCSSLTSQDALVGSAMYAELSRHYLAPEPLCTVPKEECRLPLVDLPPSAPKPPRLLRAYLALGARICGPPAIDRAFKTIDFLTLMDCRNLPPIVHQHFRV